MTCWSTTQSHWDVKLELWSWQKITGAPTTGQIWNSSFAAGQVQVISSQMLACAVHVTRLAGTRQGGCCAAPRHEQTQNAHGTHSSPTRRALQTYHWCSSPLEAWHVTLEDSCGDSPLLTPSDQAHFPRTSSRRWQDRDSVYAYSVEMHRSTARVCGGQLVHPAGPLQMHPPRRHAASMTTYAGGRGVQTIAGTADLCPIQCRVHEPTHPDKHLAEVLTTNADL